MKCYSIYRTGKPMPEGTGLKISIGRRGSNNPAWKGDKVGYISLHEWVKNHKQNTGKCELCHKEKKLDLANISGKYKRDLSDWEYLCRRCHMGKDGRLKKFNPKTIFVP